MRKSPLFALIDDFITAKTISAARKQTTQFRFRIERVVAAQKWQSVGDLSKLGFLKWRDGAENKLSNSSKNHYQAALYGFGQYLEDREVVLRNPFVKLKKLPTKKRRTFERGALSESELRKLLDSGIDDYYRAVYLIAARTGIRHGELSKLVWHDLQELDGIKPGIRLREKVAKSAETVVLPISAEVAEAFRSLRDLSPSKSGRVFWKGVPRSRTLSKHLATAGLPAIREDGAKRDFHSLRVTYATFLSPRAFLCPSPRT